LLSSIPVVAPSTDDNETSTADWTAAVAGQSDESLAGYFDTATFDCALGVGHSDTVVGDSSFSDSWTDAAGGTTTVSNSVLSTLTTTVTCNSDGSSSYAETLTSSYNFLTVYVSPVLNYTDQTWGFQNYTLTASHPGTSGSSASGSSTSGSATGAGITTTSTLDVDGSDSYFFSRSDTVLTLGADNSGSIENYNYTSTGTDNYDSYSDTTTTSFSDGSSTISQFAIGGGDGTANYGGSGDYSWSLAVGDVTTGDGSSETYDDAYVESWWDNYDYNYLDVLTTTIATDGTATYVGSIHDDGFGGGGETYWWEGSSDYSDAVPELDSYSELATFDHWIESWTDNYDYDYDETSTYFADGSETFVLNNFGGSDGTYSYLGDGTYDWLFESGDLTTGDGVEENYGDTYLESYWSNYDDAYQDILTYDWAPDGDLLLYGSSHQIDSERCCRA
jgi:hypothetical protein